MLAWAKPVAHPSAGTEDSRADRPDRNAEGDRDLLVGQRAPGEEQQRLAISRSQPVECIGQLHRQPAAFARPIGGLVGDSSVGGEPAALVSPVPASEVRDDLEQPWPGVVLAQVVARPVVERARERLRRDLVGEIASDPRPGETVNGVEMPLEHRPERPRVGQRAADRRRVRVAEHDRYCPLRLGKFTPSVGASSLSSHRVAPPEAAAGDLLPCAVEADSEAAVVRGTRVPDRDGNEHEPLVRLDREDAPVREAQVDSDDVGLDLAGEEDEPTPPPVAETDQAHTLLTVDLGGGSTATWSQSPARTGAECDRISIDGTNWSWTCADPAKLPLPIRFWVIRPPVADGSDAATLVFGVVRPGLTVTFRYQGGRAEQIPLSDQRFLVDLAREHRQPRQRLSEVVVSDASGPVLRIPIATEDESLYSSTPDRTPQPAMHQIFNPTDLPIVATLKLTGSHGEQIEFFVRRETPTHWYEVLSVDGTVVSGANLAWFPGGHDATIGLGWQPMQKPEFDVPYPLSLLMADIREPATAARVVYADGSTEPLELARPSEPVGHGISGWFVYEISPATRARKPIRFEALDASGNVVATAKPPPGA